MSHLPEGGLDSATNIRNLVKSHSWKFWRGEDHIVRIEKRVSEETKEPTTAAPRVPEHQ